MKNERFRILSARSWAALSLVGAGGCLALFVATASPQTVSASCGSVTAHTVVADAQARIYRVQSGHSLAGPLYDYYGCTSAQQNPRLLASAQAFARVRDIKLRGSVTGMIVDRTGIDTGSSLLTVLDLSGGRVLHRVATEYMVPRTFERLVRYVLESSGNIAWSTVKSIGFSDRSQVTISRAVGHSVTTLDQGAAIKASSLGLRGHRVEWLDGGRLLHASLP